MAQLERRKKLTDSPKSPKSQDSPTFEQLLRVEEAYWSSNATPGSGRACRDHEVCPSHCPSDSKKSVLSKVKDTAKKLRHSLSGRRKLGLDLHDHDVDLNNHHHHHHHHDHHHNTTDLVTLAWGATVEDDYAHEQDDDPEYLGAPMYESEAAPECLRETARQHPRAEPVVAENHRAPNMAKNESVSQQATSMITNTTHAVAGKIAPAYAAVSDAAHSINADTIKSTTQTVANKLAPACTAVSDATHTTTQTVADKLAPACAAVSDATHSTTQTVADKLSQANAAVSNATHNTTQTVADKLAQANAAVSGATHNTTQTVADKLAQANAAVSNATHNTTQTVGDKLAQANAAVSGATHNTTQTVADKLAQANAAVSGATHNTTQAVADKLAPAYAAVSDATHQIASKIAGVAGASRDALQDTSRYSEAKAELMSQDAGNLRPCPASSPQTYDKGVSVKEYFLNKLEPGEDERALSQAITEAISPRKSTGEAGVVDKVKEAVTSFFKQEENANSTPKAADLASSTAASSEVESVAELNRVASIRAEKSASPSSVTFNSSNSPKVVQTKRVATVHTEKTASPSSAVTEISSVSTNAHQPQLNRVASVHVRSTKVFADSSNNSPHIPVSSNAHEVYEEQHHGRILQTN